MLIVDTGVLLATADTTDPHHHACLDLLAEEPEPLVSTAMVIAETAYLLDRRHFGVVRPAHADVFMLLPVRP